MIIDVAKEKPQLTSLCGIKHEQTEVDLSPVHMGPGDAMLLAFDLQKNSVLCKLKYFPLRTLHFISILFSLKLALPHFCHHHNPILSHPFAVLMCLFFLRTKASAPTDALATVH